MRLVSADAPSEAISHALKDSERWYVVRTQPHRETQAARQLENQDYRVFVPRILKSRRHARKFETIRAPLFPRYIFVVLDLGRNRWRSVNGTLGVDRLLMRGGEPEAVPRGLVEQLIELVSQDGLVRCGPILKEGQSVRVTAGPFTELLGTLEQLGDNNRVRVLLDIMGGKIPVLLPEAVVVTAD